ncbi:MAG TPA: AAA family ATPase [Acidimicrobiia bacterium]|nr:AAA family ATPase [Acidimicrobiia bacterium]
MKDGRPSGTVTVLFTDLAGSTAMLSRLGEAAFDELRRGHFAGLREAVADHGGEEVKTLGDGILAVFGSAADAITCAVAVQQAVERQARTGPASLAVRIGLALGDVSFEEEDVFGTPVVEASRLVGIAQPGQILATSLVPMVAGGRSEASFIELGPQELKGLPKPVAVCEVGWAPVAAATVPLPGLFTDVGRVFVGRDDEFRQLEQLWKEAAAGDRRMALLAGEPGVGKTRLAAELARTVHDQAGAVLAGRCDEDLGVPFQPFVEALRHLTDHVADDELPSRLGRHAGELERLLPGLRERLPDAPPLLQSDPETERYRLFDAVNGWLAAASGHDPVLLVLDDLQWAAKPTLLLLRHIARSPAPMRLLIVGTYRDTELHHDHPLVELLADLRRETGIERLSLSGFDQRAVAGYMAEVAGHEMDDDGLALARAIHTETEGNPFFVREILRHLRETGALVQRDGRWITSVAVEEVGIPEGIREVVGRRVSRLSNDANRVLRVAAVVGTEFELNVVQQAGDIDDDATFSAVEEAIAARLVVETAGPVPRHRFTHALVRETLYDQLSAARRVALHRRVAEVIEQVHAGALDDQLPALAHHWARAAAPAAEVNRAVDYARRAGDRALAQLAHDEAETYYRQALELFDAARTGLDDTRRIDLLLALGVAQRLAGQPAHRETLLEAARLAGQRQDAERLARAALANRRGAAFSAMAALDTERVAVLEAALEALGAVDSPTRARLLATLAGELLWAGDRNRRLALADEALALARRLGDTAALADVLANRHFTISEPDTLDERLALTSELLGLTEHLSDPVTRAHALWVRQSVAMEVGDFVEADQCLDEFERVADELDHAFLRFFAMFCRASRVLVTGQIEEAERLAAATLAYGQDTGQPDALLLFSAQQFDVRFEQGRLGELEEGLREIVQRFPLYSLGRARLAFLYCELDQPDQARGVLEDRATGDLDGLPRDWSFLAVASLWTGVCAYLGDAPGASVLYGLLHPYRERLATSASRPNPSVSHYLGMLATTLRRFDDAAAHFAAAAATHESIGAPTWLARTRLEWARLLLARRAGGDVEQARVLLGQTLHTARELGLANVERRAAHLLSEGSS